MTDVYSNMLHDNSNMLAVYSFILDDCCTITSFMMNIYIMPDVYPNMLHDNSNMLVVFSVILDDCCNMLVGYPMCVCSLFMKPVIIGFATKRH